MRRLRASDETVALVRLLHPEVKRKMKAALQMILEQPESGKALKDDLAGLRSFRVGKFRIIYLTPLKTVIDVIVIGPRRTIYQETLRLVQASRK